MNLFRGLKGAGAAREMDIAVAVMVPIVAAMLADGMTAPEELAEIHYICTTSPIYERNAQAENDHIIARATRIIEDEGLAGALQRAADILSPALRETAFVHAVRVIFSDHYVGRLEQQVIEQMTGWLKIDRDRARTMVEVVSIMQHPETA
jgi:uncharacterized tellurite resistance protein B-like protein